MRWTSLVLTLGLLAPHAAHAAPPVTPATHEPVAAGDQQRVTLERQTGLDLAPSWRRYVALRKGESFYQFVEKDLRRKRDIGRALTFGGLGGLVVGVSLFVIAIPQPDQPLPLTIAGDVIMAVGGVSTIVGAALWGRYFRRMEKLEVSEYENLARRPRVRLQALSPTGLRLAF